MRIKIKTLLFVHLGEETELDVEEDLVTLGCLDHRNQGSAALLLVRRVRNLDQSGHSIVVFGTSLVCFPVSWAETGSRKKAALASVDRSPSKLSHDFTNKASLPIAQLGLVLYLQS